LNETRFGPKKKSSPIYLGTILMRWMSVKLADNFQIREHSWPCLFHIMTAVLYRLLMFRFRFTYLLTEDIRLSTKVTLSVQTMATKTMLNIL